MIANFSDIKIEVTTQSPSMNLNTLNDEHNDMDSWNFDEKFNGMLVMTVVDINWSNGSGDHGSIPVQVILKAQNSKNCTWCCLSYTSL